MDDVGGLALRVARFVLGGIIAFFDWLNVWEGCRRLGRDVRRTWKKRGCA